MSKSRWVVCAHTSPSGKTLFSCAVCGRESVAPDKACPSGCEVIERDGASKPVVVRFRRACQGMWVASAPYDTLGVQGHILVRRSGVRLVLFCDPHKFDFDCWAPQSVRAVDIVRWFDAASAILGLRTELPDDFVRDFSADAEWFSRDLGSAREG